MQQFDDVRQAGLDSTPLSGPFSPAWHRVFRGEVVRHLTALCAGKLLHYRGRQFLVTETYEVRYRIGGRRITENEALRLRAKKLVNLGVGETVREELEYTTHVMALLPRQFPNTEMQAVPNQRISPDAEALGFVRVDTGYPPFDQKWSVFSQDGAFVRATFGPPALDYLLTAHRQGTTPMVLVLQDVMHMKTSCSVETLAFEPLVVHMSNLLAQLNPQIWNSAPPIAL